MEKLNKELESKVKDLVKKGDALEAVKLVQKVLKCGLRNSKDIVDSYGNQDL